MNTINLQNKTRPKNGIVEKYWLRSSQHGTTRLIHRVIIPLNKFDPELPYDSNSLETRIVFDYLELNLIDPDDLDKLTITSNKNEEIEISIYIGAKHNPCDIIKLNFKKISERKYAFEFELMVDFEHEGVAQNEIFTSHSLVEIVEGIKEF